MILSLYNKSPSYRNSTPFKKNLLFYFFSGRFSCAYAQLVSMEPLPSELDDSNIQPVDI